MTPLPSLRQSLSLLSVPLALASLGLGSGLDAQSPSKDGRPGDPVAVEPGASSFLRLRAGTFDPTSGGPEIPEVLRANNDIGLFIVQFGAVPTDAMRQEVLALGAEIHGYLPDDAYVIRTTPGTAAQIDALADVRFVGAYEPAYRLDPQFVNEWLQGDPIGERRYNVVVVDKRKDKPALVRSIEALGGKVVDRQEGGLLMTVELTQQELFAVARLDQVLWIDLWSAPELDMDNARIQGGGNYVETVAGYTGQGVRGHVYEGVEAAHPDFTTRMTNVSSGGEPASHGHCTAGIVFGNGSSSAAARGMAPDAVGFYTNYNSDFGSRNSIVGTLVNTHNAMFTTASWGNSRTTAYTSISADADDIVFDHRIAWTQSQSNAGNQQSRPQAWAKNVFSIGGVRHRNNSNRLDDSWAAGNASTGPAADGRIKPDLCAYYDQILTSDRTGSAGYTSNSVNPNFGGTSGATPIVAGHNAIAIQMYADGLFGSSTIRVPGGSVFQNRPLAQTLKALMIVGADQYSFNASSSDNRREHQGWGFPNLRNLYDNRNDIFVVPEDRFLSQGATDSFTVSVTPNEPNLKICMTYVEPAGNPAASRTRINDLNLRVTSPTGVVYFGNAGLRTGTLSTQGGSFDAVDTVECVFVQNPTAGDWFVEVIGSSVVQDAEITTAGVDASYALAVLGGTSNGSGPGPAFCDRFLPDNTPDSGSSLEEPFGAHPIGNVDVGGLSNSFLSDGGAVYMDLQLTDRATIHKLRLNMQGTLGAPASVEMFVLPKGTSVFGNEDQRQRFALRSRASGIVLFPNFLTDFLLEEPIVLEPGTYGVALVSTGFGHRVITGSGAQTFGNGSFQVVSGTASETAFQGPILPGVQASVSFGFADHSVDNAPSSNVRYQTIIRANELGDAGNITGLAFAANWTGVHSSESLDVTFRMVPPGYTLSNVMAQNSFTGTNVLSRTDHDWFVQADEWNSIGLERAFAYDGTSDLVVDVLVRGNVISHPGGAFLAATNRPRIAATNWTGTPPLLGNINDANGLKMRVQFGCADAQTYGSGCGGMTLGVESRPIVDQSFRVTSQTQRPLTAAALHIGVTAGAPYPFRLDFFGFPDCVLWNDVLTTLPGFSDFNGDVNFQLVAPPNLPGISDNPFYVQALQLNPDFPGGVTASNYGRLVIGSDL